MMRRPVLFTFILALVVFLVNCSIGREFAMASKMNRVHFGMTEAQVRAIMGDPENLQYAPFDPSCLPKHLECGDCPGAENCYIENAVRCAKYKKYSSKSKDGGSYSVLEVYYDAGDKVCCKEYSTGSEWSIITH